MNVTNFEQFNISPELLKALAEMGFTSPTPIQSQAIPKILEGHDVTGQAQTGTGKTAAFALPAIQNLDPSEKNVQVLVLCPTRELAVQVSEEFKKLVKFIPQIRVLPVYGGASIEMQFRELKKGVHIVIGTPGRVIDHINRGTLKLHLVQQIILDEADEMLDMGFREDIEKILEELPQERQTILFSATMSKPILEITKRFQNNPVFVKMVKDELTVSGITQRYFELKEKDKIAVLERLVKLYEPKLCLVFCNTKRKVDELVGQLQREGFPAEALHGDMNQGQRTQVMSKFRLGLVQVLIATDVAARGLDVENVEMVVNFDMPMESEYYVHRIGRTGRAGRTGHAFSFVTRGDTRKLKDVERFTKVQVIKEEIPTTKAIDEKKKTNLLQKIIHTITNESLSSQMAILEELQDLEIGAIDIAAALLKMEMDRSGLDKKPADTIERVSFDKDGRDSDRGRKGSDRKSGKGSRERKPFDGKKQGKREGDSARLFINLGKKNHINARDIVGAIAGESGIEGNRIGEIDIYDNFSFVNVPREDASHIINAIKKSNIKGYRCKIEFAE